MNVIFGIKAISCLFTIHIKVELTGFVERSGAAQKSSVVICYGSHCSLSTSGVCVVRDYEALHFQTRTKPSRLFIISNFTPSVRDGLAVLHQSAAV